MQTWIVPDWPLKSSVNVVLTTISAGIAMLANCGWLSDRVNTSSIGWMLSHARPYSLLLSSISFLIRRCSVIENSRPSLLRIGRPVPPNIKSTIVLTSCPSSTSRAEPASGRVCMMLMLAGSWIVPRKSL